jgi:hypothetical protein
MTAEDLKRRTKSFALRIIKLLDAVLISKQLLRSATSIGAHYRAACRAQSRAEFFNSLLRNSSSLSFRGATGDEESRIPFNFRASFLAQFILSSFAALRTVRSGEANGLGRTCSGNVFQQNAKLSILVEEADETLYWLELLGESGLVKGERLTALMKEAGELVNSSGERRPPWAH